MQPKNHPDDKQFEEWGVSPPTREGHGTDEDIARNLTRTVRHEWRQRGAVLFCIACPFEHATEPRFVDYLLQGTDDDGKPILKKVDKNTIKRT